MVPVDASHSRIRTMTRKTFVTARAVETIICVREQMTTMWMRTIYYKGAARQHVITRKRFYPTTAMHLASPLFSVVVLSDIIARKLQRITVSARAIAMIAHFPSLSRKFTQYLMYMRVLTLPDGLVSYRLAFRPCVSVADIFRFLLSISILFDVWSIQCDLLDTR